jgi:hypothetical protein
MLQPSPLPELWSISRLRFHRSVRSGYGAFDKPATIQSVTLHGTGLNA